jgi:hypothetical protein
VPESDTRDARPWISLFQELFGTAMVESEDARTMKCVVVRQARGEGRGDRDVRLTRSTAVTVCAGSMTTPVAW